MTRTGTGTATFTDWIAAHPVLSIAMSLAVAFGLAAGGQPSTSNDGTDLAPSAEALQASARIDELFPDQASTSALQVIVDNPDGILTSDGVADVQAVRQLARDTFADRLANTGVISPLEPLLAAPPGAPDSAQPPPLPDTPDALAQALENAADNLPPDVAGRLAALWPADVQPVDATAALVVILVEEGDGLLDVEEAFADDLAGLDGVTAAAFSPNLVSAQDLGTEILALLGVAVLVILSILVLLFFPSGSMSWVRRARRAAADALTTVLVALLSVQAANGFAAWMGPDNLGWLGARTGPGQAVPILLIGLAVDYVIHLNREYRDELHDGVQPRQATALALAGVRRALILSGITTVLGFLTNTLSGIAGLRDFGIVAAFGIVMALLFTFLLFPSIRQLLDRLAVRRDRDLGAGLDADRDGRLAGAITGLAGLTRRPWATTAVAVAITVAGGMAATNLAVEFSFLDFVPTDSPLRATAERLNNEFDGGGGETVRILVEGDVDSPDVAQALTTAQDNVTTVETIQQVSAVDTTDGAAVIEAVAQQIEDPDAFVTAIDTAFEPVTQLGASATATSLTLNDNAIVDRLSTIQVQSLVLAIIAALVVLAGAFWLSNRRPLVGVVTVVPVAMSVIVLFGVMAVVGIPFTPVTATLAALAIGIGVDYAIHLTSRWVRERDSGADPDTAVRESLTTTGSALAGSGVTTAAGFAVLMLSSLIPFKQLGQVTLIGIVTAVLATTMVLPSMLMLTDRRTRDTEGEPAA